MYTGWEIILKTGKDKFICNPLQPDASRDIAVLNTLIYFFVNFRDYIIEGTDKPIRSKTYEEIKAADDVSADKKDK